MRPFLRPALVLLCAFALVAAGADTPPPAIDIAAPTDPPPSPPGHLACAVDADCVRVFRRCGTCDCGAPLARQAIAADAAERDERCREVVAPGCELECGRTLRRGAVRAGCRRGIVTALNAGPRARSRGAANGAISAASGAGAHPDDPSETDHAHCPP